MTLPAFFYNRQPFEGVFIPRSDLIGWQVDIGSESFTRQMPGPVSEADIELDSIGCLTAASIALKVPRHPIFPAYALAVKFWAESATRGLVPIAVGYIAAATQESLESYNLPVLPLEDLSMNDYYDGSLAGADGGIEQAALFMQKNSEIVTAALKDNPKASIGVDHTGSVRLAEPSDGQAVLISQARFYEWKNTGLITLPYGTRSRWDGGPGWLKGEYVGISRPPYAERRAVDAGEVVFTEVTRESGPPLVTVAEVSINAVLGIEPDVPALPDATAPEPGVSQGPQLIKSTVTAQEYAVIHVYDLEAWYLGSSLPGQADSAAVKALQDTLNATQEAFRLSVDVLGESHPLAQQQRQSMNAAKNALRLGRVGDSAHTSDYEPLTAKLSTGFVIEEMTFFDPYSGEFAKKQDGKKPFEAGYSILTGTSIFISMLPWDTKAVGLANVNPDTDDDSFSSLIHPLLSGSTVKTFDSPLVELDEFSVNTPFMQGTLEIPPDYFRGPMGPALAQILDKKWADSFEDGPPIDAVPPSENWDGRWYFYICCWWRVVGPEREGIPT